MVTNSKSKQASADALRRSFDIGGFVLFFLGAAALVCLRSDQHAALTPWVDRGLRIVAGRAGAYAAPLLLMALGTMFLIGYERLSLTASSAGVLLLFLAGETAMHLLGVPRANPQLDLDAISRSGGWIGALFAIPLRTLLGETISALFLVTAAAIGGVLIAGRSVAEMGAAFAERMRAANAVSRKRAQQRKARRASVPRTNRALPAADANLPARESRNERAKRVVERALDPSSGKTPADSEEPVRPEGSLNKLLRIFHRTPTEQEETDRAHFPNAEEAPVPVQAESAAPAPAVESKRAPKAVVAQRAAEEAGQLPLPVYVPPSLSLLKDAPPPAVKRNQADLTDNIQVIEQTLEQFNIGANVVEVASGPTVTRYEIQLAPGIKVNKIVNLADNLAMSLAAIDVRIEAPIPGKSAIGVEVPNANPVVVSLKECLDTDEYRNAPSRLTVALGKDVAGQFRYADLTRMPHLLIGGSTNSGKSVCLNTLIASLVFRSNPREVKLMMIDPKRVELSLWEGIPHLMHPVVKDVKQAAGLFRQAIKEMDRRYDLFAALGTRNIDGYNEKVPENSKLPFVVLIVDELADLMMQQGAEVEQSICRLAQLARATGIHLVLATQRPSVDIITGTIKSNISSRIAFAVASQVDSRTILDSMGAEGLIGRGDMLFLPIGASKPIRIQGCYMGEEETNTLVNYLRAQEKPDYCLTLDDAPTDESGDRGGDVDENDDAFFERAVRLVVNNGQASTSMLQRRFRIGYTRAARIVEMMEDRNIVGPLNGAKPREILWSKDDVERQFNPGGPLPSEQYVDDNDEVEGPF